MKLRITLNKRNVDTLKPAEMPWVAWDDRLTGGERNLVPRHESED